MQGQLTILHLTHKEAVAVLLQSEEMQRQESVDLEEQEQQQVLMDQQQLLLEVAVVDLTLLQKEQEALEVVVAVHLDPIQEVLLRLQMELPTQVVVAVEVMVVDQVE